MELFETLKQFKQIQPDAAYTAISKRAILATTPRESWSAKRILIAVIETGLALGLDGFFILIATGQFFGVATPYVPPVQLSVITPDTLHAEAQAIDMQIELAKLSYQESTTTARVSTPKLTPGANPQSKPLIL